MIRILGQTLSLLASIIIALHAIIPHPHAETLTANKHSEIHRQSNSFIGVIRFLFHESDDTNLDTLVYADCENGKKSIVENADLSAIIADKLFIKTNAYSNEKTLSFQINDFAQLNGINPNGLRGPPLSFRNPFSKSN